MPLFCNEHKFERSFVAYNYVNLYFYNGECVNSKKFYSRTCNSLPIRQKLIKLKRGKMGTEEMYEPQRWVV